MDRAAKLLNPLLALIALTLALMINNAVMPESFKDIVSSMLIIVGLFVFGILLSYRKKRSRSWIKKVIISIIMFIIIITQLNIAQFNAFLSVFDIITRNNAVLYSLIVYFGWAFFE